MSVVSRSMLLLALLLGVLAVVPSAAEATGKVGGFTVGTTATCVRTSGVLTAVKVPSVGVRMRSAWASSYKSQYVKVTARLQGRAATGWSNVTSSGASRSRTVLVSRSYVNRSLTVAMTAPKVPARHRDAYRITVRADWYSPRTGKVEGSTTKVVGKYRLGTAVGTTCAAAQAPAGPSNLSVVATGTSQQVRATYDVQAAVLPQVVSCSPACATTSVPALGQAGATSLITSTDYANGTVGTARVRSCLAAHLSICSGWVDDTTTPFGPIATPTITVAASGQCFTWTAKGNGAGKAVDVAVSASGMTTSTFTATDAFERVGTGFCPGYSTSRTFTVKVTDRAATVEQVVDRGSKTASAASTTPPKPPSVTTRRGPTCGSCPGAIIPCTTVCYYVLTTGHDFVGTATCHLIYRDSGPTPVQWAQGNTETNSGNWAAPGVEYLVSCSNGANSGWQVQ